MRPPSYLISQVDGDYSALSYQEYNDCLKPAFDAMLNALLRATNFFSNLPVNSLGDDGYPIMLQGEMLQRKYEYEEAFRSYYQEIEMLKSCQPFCNIESVFNFEALPKYP